MTQAGGGGSLPHIFCIHVRLGPIYPGGLFTLHKRLKGMVFIIIMVNAGILIHPINNFITNLL